MGENKKHWARGVSVGVPADSDHTLPSEAITRCAVTVEFVDIVLCHRCKNGRGTGAMTPHFSWGQQCLLAPLLIRPRSRSAEASLNMLNTLKLLESGSEAHHKNKHI